MTLSLKKPCYRSTADPGRIDTGVSSTVVVDASITGGEGGVTASDVEVSGVTVTKVDTLTGRR